MAEWQPIETAPKEGVFLVYMPDEPEWSRFQVARWHPNAKVIGHVFAFDLSKPTHWQPLPAQPSANPDDLCFQCKERVATIPVCRARACAPCYEAWLEEQAKCQSLT